MKSFFKSFLFVGIFVLVFLNLNNQDVSAATSNTCDAQYTTVGGTAGVMFTLINEGNALPANSNISVEFASTAANVGLGQSSTATYVAGSGSSSIFQASTIALSSPDPVYYRFVLDGWQQYCPPTGTKSLTASTTTTTSGAGAGGSQACPTGQIWNPALNQCTPTAQTVGGSQSGSGNQGSGQLGGQGEGQLGGQGEGQLGGQGEGQFGSEDENPNNNITNPRLINPLGGVDSIEGFLEKLFNIVLRIAIPIIALAIIYSGFLFVTAQGKEEKLTTAKKTLLYTLIGAAIILGAWVIANALSETVNDIREDVGLHNIKDIA